MQKPIGYDEAQAISGDFTPLPPGGYVCEILKADVGLSKSGQEMLILDIDIVEGEQRGYFKRMNDESQNGNGWPCVYRQLTDGNSLGFFKGLIESIVKSNPGFHWNWDERTLSGKKVGGVFGREEYFNQNRGEYRWSTKMLAARSVQDIRSGDFKVPADKPAKKVQQPQGYAPPQGFSNMAGQEAPYPQAPFPEVPGMVYDAGDEDLPF